MSLNALPRHNSILLLQVLRSQMYQSGLLCNKQRPQKTIAIRLSFSLTRMRHSWGCSALCWDGAQAALCVSLWRGSHLGHGLLANDRSSLRGKQKSAMPPRSCAQSWHPLTSSHTPLAKASHTAKPNIKAGPDDEEETHR